MSWRRRRPDLRRDCDAGRPGHCLFWSRTTKTWFTKGLRPLSSVWYQAFPAWRRRPDLRRDCDFLQFLQFLQKLQDDEDLIYEGIATDVPIFIFLFWHISKTTKTWFTKGLRPGDNPAAKTRRRDDEDLIYEGIATHDQCFQCLFCSTDDEDLIYEGIATAPDILLF